MSILSVIRGKYGLKLNKSKTKIMIVEDNYEVVNNFNYLGSLITNTGKCESEIRRRLTMAKISYYQAK